MVICNTKDFLTIYNEKSDVINLHLTALKLKWNN